MQVQLRALEKFPLYTFEAPQAEGRPQSKTCLSSLDVRVCSSGWVCVCVRARVCVCVRAHVCVRACVQTGFCEVRPQPLPKLIRTTWIMSIWSWRPAWMPWKKLEAHTRNRVRGISYVLQCQQHFTILHQIENRVSTIGSAKPLVQVGQQTLSFQPPKLLWTLQ